MQINLLSVILIPAAGVGSRRSKRCLIIPVLVGLMAIGCSASTPDGDGDWPDGLGAPQAAERDIRMLQNEGFTIGYDRARQEAAWVAYRVQSIGRFEHMPRPSFQADPRLDRKPATGKYAGSDFDRGHLAPNYAISQLYGRRAQRETFYYSNVMPQRQRLNQLVWQRLEEIETDHVARRVGTLWVVLGPVPSDRDGPPEAFFRIWLARGANDDWQALAFRVPQRVRGDERLDRFLVSVDRIEAATGLDFFTGLDDAVEDRLETKAAPAETLGFAAWACQPARYGRRWQGRDGIDLDYDRCGSR